MKVLSAVAWPYANGPRHIGHVSGFGVPSDVFSRYMRMAGHEVLMVSGTDEHGTPILVQADRRGVTPRELADTVQPGDRRGPAAPGPVVRPVHPHRRPATTTRWRRSCFQALHRNGYMVEQTTRGRDLAVDRAHAARPLHRGHLPDLRLRRRARRPVRQLRQPARPGRPDQPAQPKINGETPKFVETEHFFLDLPALADALGEWLAERTGTGAPTCSSSASNLLDDLRPRAMTRDIDWGIPVPLDGWRDQPDQAALRLVRRGDRLPLGLGRVGPARRRPRRVAEWWNDPGRPRLLLHGQGQHHASTRRSGRRCSPTTAKDKGGGEPGAFGKLNLPTEVVSSEYLTMRGSKFSTSRGGRHLRARLPRALRRRRAALLHLRRRPGEPGHRLHLGRVRAAHQRRAGRRLGQPGQPLDLDGAQERRRGPEAAGPLEADDEALLATVHAGFGTVGDLIGGTTSKQAIGEAMRVVTAANRYLSDQEPVEAQGRPGPPRRS